MPAFNFPVTAPGLPEFEPAIAVNLLNPAIMIAVAVDTNNPGNTPQTGVYRSVDGGANWTTIHILPLPAPFTSAEAPFVAYAFPNTFYVTAHAFDTTSDGTCIVYKSTNNGTDFDPPVIVNRGYGSYINNDETLVTVDNGQSSPYFGNVYVSYNHQFNVQNNGNSTAFVNRSNNGGTTWDQPDLLSSESTRVERPDVTVNLVGQVYGAWITNAPTTNFIVRRSDDGGTTYNQQVIVSPVVLVPTVLPVPNYAFRVLTFANIATDNSVGPFTNRVYAVWQDFQLGYSDIFMSISNDRGQSWSVPVSITNATPGSQNFFPAIDVDPLLGVVNVIYYSNQLNGFDLDVFVARSINGGATFTNSRVTTTSFSPNGSSPTPVPIIGDYIDIISVPPGGYIGIWTDLRNGSLQIYCGYNTDPVT
ncbi:hypothetical protein FHS18_002312 [Paenibacillus phyllosphaerae]|uniref:Exo-alpha-sialidase n=1 Tax=Paenibacillus phyllosphaerae TaxID=274593 RepID=A0A7W5FMG5_9BACL|nr:sialidase family protein [Paenibacillus phyllosphaerae]MBB3110245.1 hypothetical protein [Paenibacillus phyllosphaerae]